MTSSDVYKKRLVAGGVYTVELGVVCIGRGEVAF